MQHLLPPVLIKPTLVAHRVEPQHQTTTEVVLAQSHSLVTSKELYLVATMVDAKADLAYPAPTEAIVAEDVDVDPAPAGTKSFLTSLELGSKITTTIMVTAAIQSTKERNDIAFK